MKSNTTAARRMARQAALHGAFCVPWRDLPYQTIANTAVLSGRSTAHVYHLIHTGVLLAVSLAGKTLVTTGSLIALLDGASPWRPNRDRLAAAVARRTALSKQSAPADDDNDGGADD